MRNRFYCVCVTISRSGDRDKPVNYYYKSPDRAEEHIDQYRQETLRGRNDYNIAKDEQNELLLRNDNGTECRLQLSECYFED